MTEIPETRDRDAETTVRTVECRTVTGQEGTARTEADVSATEIPETRDRDAEMTVRDRQPEEAREAAWAADPQ